MTRILAIVLASAFAAGGAFAHNAFHEGRCPPGLVQFHHGCVAPGHVRYDRYDRRDSIAWQHRQAVERNAARHRFLVEQNRVRHDLAVQRAAARHRAEVLEALRMHDREVHALRRDRREHFALNR